jgi:hypothetical protein
MKRFLIGIMLAIVLTFGGTIAANAVDPYPYRMPKADANGQEVIVLMGLIAQDGHEVLGVVDDKLGNYMLWVVINGNCGAYFLQVDPKMVIPMTCAQGLMLFEQSVSRGDTIDPRQVKMSVNGITGPHHPHDLYAGFGIGGYGAFGSITGIGPIGPFNTIQPD